eukprot:3658712-Karenia_brevis.AAC.1
MDANVEVMCPVSDCIGPHVVHTARTPKYHHKLVELLQENSLWLPITFDGSSSDGIKPTFIARGLASVNDYL